MAIKPALYEIKPFNIEQGTTVRYSFSYSYTNMAKSELRIYEASSLKLVGTISNYSTEWSVAIPPSWVPYNTTGAIWKNGGEYCAEIAIYIYTDAGHTVMELSSISDKMFFRTYSAPLFTFADGIEENMTINTTSLTVKLRYYQSEGEQLYKYTYMLYENSEQVYRSTETFYTSTMNALMSYTFKGLKNGQYYLRAVGATKNYIPLDTGMIPFTVDHSDPIESNVLKLRDDEYATVYGNTNVKPIDPDEHMYENGNQIYFCNDSCVNLKTMQLTYEMNYLVQNDFTLTLRIRNVNKEGTIYYGTNVLDKTPMKITVYTFDNGMSRFHLKVGNEVYSRNYYTEEFKRSEVFEITLHVRRKDDLYHMEMFVVKDDEYSPVGEDD